MKPKPTTSRKVKESPAAPPSYVLIQDAFTAVQCAELRAYALSQPGQAGVVGYGGKPQQHDMRRSAVRWLDMGEPALSPLKDRIRAAALRANAQHWGLDYRDFGELQFTEYVAWNAGHYDWHRDDSPDGTTPWDRLLTAVVALSSEAECQGGQFYIHGTAEPLPLRQGSLLLFPAATRHAVAPVTAGARYSLVCWFQGPKINKS